MADNLLGNTNNNYSLENIFVLVVLHSELFIIKDFLIEMYPFKQ